ncbi:MAG TPA: HAMP domain-containing sensor histidine kinase [Balneolaceae bacterium]|nr:HAMP domain-containing sensor histidine kinase [Balneolaceae bacterium]
MPQTPNHQELKSLAGYLLENDEAILDKWEELVKKKVAQTSELRSLSQKKFRDNIPTFLHQFCNSLSNEKDFTEKIAHEHGANRWEHGFELQETAWEWSILHNVLMKQINRYEEAFSLGLNAFKQALSLLTRHIHEGIIFSVEEYQQLQRAEAEARLRDLKQAIEEPEEFSHSDDLRQTSHDVKGMLHVIRTGFYLLKDKNFDEKTADTLDQMSNAAESLKQLLDELLDLFRLEAGKEQLHIESFDVAELLGDLCNSYQPMAQDEQLDLWCRGDEKLVVRSDPQKVKRIVQNLLLNSLKYTQSGFVEVQWKLREKNYWMIQISDSGPGLSATHAASLTTKSTFPPSPRESRKETSGEDKSAAVRRHGEGIGLLIVRRLCELLKAVIEVKTEKDKGTTYRIILPVEAKEGG